MCSDQSPVQRTKPVRQDVLAGVVEIVAEQLGASAERLRESDALETLGCDSLDIVEIAMQLEERFDISVPDEFADRVRTIGEVTDGVLQLLIAAEPERMGNE